MIYTGSITRDGYGYLCVAKDQKRVHRLVWEHHHGSLRSRDYIEHTCGNRACVEIGHLRMREKSPGLRVLQRTVATDGGCLEFIGSRTALGYGQINFGGRVNKVHRIVWEHFNGLIPAGMEVCHSCDNPACCRIEHLWLGTHADNMADMAAKGRMTPHNAQKTHCPQGHPYSDENTYTPPSGGGRSCRACKQEHHRTWLGKQS